MNHMPLIDHLSLGVSNIEEARSFYDGVMSSLGCDCLAAGEGFATYGQGRVEFLLLHPFDGGAPTAGVALPFNLRRDAFGDNFCP